MFCLRHESSELYIAFIRCLIGGGCIREHVHNVTVTAHVEHAATFATRTEADTFAAMIRRSPRSLDWGAHLIVAEHAMAVEQVSP